MQLRFLIAIGAAALIGGCGSSTKTVTETTTVSSSGSGTTSAQSAAQQDLSEAAANSVSTTTPAVPTVLPCNVAASIPAQRLCTLDGSTLHLEHGTAEVRLRTLQAQIVSVRTSPTVSNGSDFTSNAKGIFFIVSLKVTNTSNAPQTFAGSGQTQTLLELGGNSYSESFTAENENDAQSFLTQQADSSIQPGESLTGDLVYDIPPSKAATATDDANNALFIGNLGDDLSESMPAGAGIISLKGA